MHLDLICSSCAWATRTHHSIRTDHFAIGIFQTFCKFFLLSQIISQCSRSFRCLLGVLKNSKIKIPSRNTTVITPHFKYPKIRNTQRQWSWIWLKRVKFALKERLWSNGRKKEKEQTNHRSLKICIWHRKMLKQETCRLYENMEARNEIISNGRFSENDQESNIILIRFHISSANSIPFATTNVFMVLALCNIFGWPPGICSPWSPAIANRIELASIPN